MPPKYTIMKRYKHLCTMPFVLLLIAPVSILFFTHLLLSTISNSTAPILHNALNVYVADLPRSLNYGLLEEYWSSSAQDARISSDPDHSRSHIMHYKFPPYPENPLIKQYSAEYWMTGDLMTPEKLRGQSLAKRVFDPIDADVVFVPFFSALSAEMELMRGKSTFKKKLGNEDYARQKEAVEIVKRSDAWMRTGGRDHVFVLTNPMAMWHVRSEIAPAILLVVDFGGWHRLDSKSQNGTMSETVQHTQVSLLKDVIVPYTYFLPRLHLSENKKRPNLLYFRGAKHRHQEGAIREKLWDLLVNETMVIIEEGFPNATGRDEAVRGMRTSNFCLHPAGDTPTSCRLFDAIQSLCIPVIVSDHIELPFEGLIDYSEFSVFAPVRSALSPSWLVDHLRNISASQRDDFRRKMAEVQPIFQFENGHPGGVGPIAPDGAVNHIWKKVRQKLPVIKEAISRDKRKPPGVSVPLRCHCS